MSELLKYVPEQYREDVANRLATGDIPPAPPERPLPSRPSHLGSRGGTTATKAEGHARLERSRSGDLAAVRAAILEHAASYPDVHADDVAHVEVAQRSVVGAAFNGLLSEGLLVKTGERRTSKTAASHGRSSYVYRAAGTGSRRPVTWRGLTGLYTDAELAEMRRLRESDAVDESELWVLHEIKARLDASFIDAMPDDQTQQGLFDQPEGEQGAA